MGDTYILDWRWNSGTPWAVGVTLSSILFCTLNKRPYSSIMDMYTTYIVTSIAYTKLDTNGNTILVDLVLRSPPCITRPTPIAVSNWTVRGLEPWWKWKWETFAYCLERSIIKSQGIDTVYATLAVNLETVRVLSPPLNGSVPSWTTRIRQHILGNNYTSTRELWAQGLTKKILAVRRVREVVGQIIPEVFDVCAKGCNGVRSNKAVHFHVPVHSIPDFPSRATQICAAHLSPDWRSIPVSAEPDQSKKDDKIQ